MAEGKVAQLVQESLACPRTTFLSLAGVPIKGPLTPEVFASLWHRAQPSTYGQRASDERFSHPDLRHSREITDVLFDFKFLQDLTAVVYHALFRHTNELEAAQRELDDNPNEPLVPCLPEGYGRFALRFHKCLLYDEHGLFAEHADKLWFTHMTHTVVVNLEVSDPEQEYTFRFNGRDYSLTDHEMGFVLFRRDVLHGVTMKKGYRVCLVFHVLDHGFFPRAGYRSSGLDGTPNQLVTLED